MKKLFKACGIRNPNDLSRYQIKLIDLIGINFSPHSKRRVNQSQLNEILALIPLEKRVFIFYKNSVEEIREIVSDYSCQYIQLYEEAIVNQFVPESIIRAYSVSNQSDIQFINEDPRNFAYRIIEGEKSGKAKRISITIDLSQLTIPFILAGGICLQNLEEYEEFKNCIGFDIASGLEKNQQINCKNVDQLIGKIKYNLDLNPKFKAKEFVGC